MYCYVCVIVLTREGNLLTEESFKPDPYTDISESASPEVFVLQLRILQRLCTLSLTLADLNGRKIVCRYTLEYTGRSLPR